MRYFLPLLSLFVCLPGTARAAAPTFQSLMDPACFAEPQRGMKVESARFDEGTLRIRTTGAELAVDSKSLTFSFRQRIGHEREVVRLNIESQGGGAVELTHSNEALAFAKFASPRFDLRANGDSLFMIHAREPLRITVRRAVEAGFYSSWKSNHILLDEYGGFGLYCSETELKDAFDPYEAVTARYELPADAVLWVGICPPKPFDWKRSLTDHVIWHWSNTLGYPDDATLAAWSKHGNTVLLQSEVMLWKDWNLAFEPRLGAEEFSRVRETMHRLGMRFIVYTSPYYYLKGTPNESAAMNSFVNFKNWPSGNPTGMNIEQFLAAITKVYREHKPDGLYFDGQYSENPAALYALARRTRALIGEDGILEWHSTNALGPDFCFLPQADAYVDYILRGEGREPLYGDDRYLRYFVSCYNTSNSIGVLCNNGSRPTPDLARRLLSFNARLHTLAGWLNDPALVDLMQKEYKLRLTESLRGEVDKGVEQRQARLPEQLAALVAEHRMLRTPPKWGKPLFVAPLASLDGWTQSVSPLNPSPFAVTADGLSITAKASTYAYLTRPLDMRVNGVVVKLRRNTDKGAAWGPAVCLRWKVGSLVRIGVRSDGLIQGDLCGDHRYGGAAPAADWIWLRVRWGERAGVVEFSRDGKTYEHLWDFEHGGALSAHAENVSVGKVPYHGKPQDFTDPGPAGTSTIAEVTLY